MGKIVSKILARTAVYFAKADLLDDKSSVASGEKSRLESFANFVSNHASDKTRNSIVDEIRALHIKSDAITESLSEEEVDSHIYLQYAYVKARSAFVKNDEDCKLTEENSIVEDLIKDSPSQEE